MGEEKKAEEKKMEEKKAEEVVVVVKKSGEENEKKEENKPVEEKQEEKKKTEETKEQNPPPLQEIVLKVYMHCEGCARKVRRCLKGFEGVEEVLTDCKSHKVIVKGEKADPLKVLDRVQRKSHRQVELLSPIPKPPPAADEPKPEEKEKPKPQEKKEEAQVVTVVLRVHMHCEACAQEIKKRILRMKGVESVEPDLKNSSVSVTGLFDPPKLVEYVYKRTGKHAILLKQEPEKKDQKEEEGKEAAAKEEKPNEDGKEKKGEEETKENKEALNSEAKAEAVAVMAMAMAGEETKGIMEMKKNEYYYYPQRYAMEMYAYPPQIFSDENPNACSVM